ncbi:MAG: helix-turn-helix transcriptional regulator [Proteobacteria bacterium]|nr:helix-turn-helix transcriptional regulator [Pseudomonadota bacterium]
MDTIGSRLKAVRQEKGWSQLQLAEAAGVSQSAIGNIESGQRKRPRDLVSIGAALGVSAEWLETGKSESERPVLRLVGADQPPTVRDVVEQLAAIARKERPTLRKNLGNLLVELVEHPDDPDVIEQTITDIERFFGPAT